MGLFLSWYLSKLKSHPTATNLASALVIMSVGDVMAQELERYKLGDAVTGSSSELEGVPEGRLLHMRQYNKFLHHQNQHVVHKEQQQQQQHQNDKNNDDDDEQPLGSQLRYKDENDSRDWRRLLEALSQVTRDDIDSWDGFRTFTMAVWGAGMYSPAFMALYRLYDRYLPIKTPAVVAFQVACNVGFSIPTNAVFFTYGSFVHHTTEWLDKVEDMFDEKEALKNNDGSYSNTTQSLSSLPPFDWELMWSTAQLKLDAELYNTVVTSAKVWIPFNALCFSVLPRHCQPLALMGFSVFWNCYLSLVQHRDVALPPENELAK